MNILIQVANLITSTQISKFFCKTLLYILLKRKLAAPLPPSPGPRSSFHYPHGAAGLAPCRPYFHAPNNKKAPGSKDQAPKLC